MNIARFAETGLSWQGQKFKLVFFDPSLSTLPRYGKTTYGHGQIAKFTTLPHILYSGIIIVN